MADETLDGELLELPQFPLQPVGNLFVNSGLGGEEPDHDRLLLALLDRPTEDARVALV